MLVRSRRNDTRWFLVACILAVSLSLIGCKLAVNDDVYPLAGAKARTIATATVTPGDGTEYAFTYTTQPSIAISCPVSGSTAFYSIDGGAYTRYTAPFTLPVADPKVDQTFTVTSYISHPAYRDSAPVTQSYRFVATIAPTPTLSLPAASYYRYDKPPTVSATCSLPGATLWYSVDGGANYTQFTNSFTVPVPADKSAWNANRDVTVTVYASATGYADSATASAQPLHFYGQYAIVTIAGTGIIGYTGDGGDARNATLHNPQGVCVDGEGNVYIADFDNHCVRTVRAADGTITTIAGNGSAGDFGDSSPALGAILNRPSGLAIDSEKKILYVVDSTNFKVKALNLTTGTIYRFIGGGSITADKGVSRLDAMAIYPISAYFANGNLFIGDRSNGCVWYVDADIAKTTSLLQNVGGANEPTGVWVRGNELYIANKMIHTIQKCNITDASPSFTKVGSELTIDGSFQPCVDGANVYFTESSGNRVTLYNETANAYTVIAGTSSGAAAATASDEVEGAMPGVPSLKNPMGMFLVPHDGLYVADRDNNRVRKIILY